MLGRPRNVSGHDVCFQGGQNRAMYMYAMCILYVYRIAMLCIEVTGGRLAGSAISVCGGYANTYMALRQIKRPVPLA